MGLSETKLRKLKTTGKVYKVFDLEGLFILVNAKGTKKWRMKFELKGKESTITFGDYPDISLKEARQKRDEVKENLERGLSPQEVKREEVELLKEIEAKASFEEIAKEWIQKNYNRWAQISREDNEGKLKNHILPHLGSRAIDEISPQDVLTAIRLLENKKKFETASKCLGICSQVFRYAVACALCKSDPCRDLKGALTFHKVTPRAAITKPDEAGRLMKLIQNYAFHTLRNAMLFSAYTFCRPIEIRKAEWEEIDYKKNLWIIPAEKMKMRREHIVPLARQSLEVLNNMKGIDDKWIFPSTRAGRCLSEAGVLSALRNLGYAKNEMCAHGFRAMASTLLNEKGYRFDLIEKSLAHVEGNKVRAAYNRAEYLEERISMMQEYADYLDELAKEST